MKYYKDITLLFIMNLILVIANIFINTTIPNNDIILKLLQFILLILIGYKIYKINKKDIILVLPILIHICLLFLERYFKMGKIHNWIYISINFVLLLYCYLLLKNKKKINSETV